MKMRSRRRSTSAAKREDDERRRRDLAKLLVEMCLSLRSQPAQGRGFPTDEMVAKVLAVQTLHLDALEVRDLVLTPAARRLTQQFLHRHSVF